MKALYRYPGPDGHTMAGARWRGGSRLLVVYQQGPKWVKAVEVGSLEHHTLAAEDMRHMIEVEVRPRTRYIMQAQIDKFKRLNREAAKAHPRPPTPCPFNETAAEAAIEALRG